MPAGLEAMAKPSARNEHKDSRALLEVIILCLNRWVPRRIRPAWGILRWAGESSPAWAPSGWAPCSGNRPVCPSSGEDVLFSITGKILMMSPDSKSFLLKLTVAAVLLALALVSFWSPLRSLVLAREFPAGVLKKYEDL